MQYKESFYNIDLGCRDNGRRLLFNSFSGAVFEFDSCTYADLIAINSESPFFDKMIEQGFIVPVYLDEVERIKYTRFVNVFNSNPSKLQFVIAPTLACNLNCIYCFENDASDIGTMDEQTFSDTFSFITSKMEKNSLLKQLQITWFGGEPLLMLDGIEKFSARIINYCCSHNIEYSGNVISNGLLLNNSTLEQLKRSKIRSIQVTLDGDAPFCIGYKSETKEAFDRITNTLIELAKELRVIIRLNTSRENRENVLKLACAFAEQPSIRKNGKIYFAQIKPYIKTEYNGCTPLNDKEFDIFLSYAEKMLIKAGMPTMAVSRFPKNRATYCGSVRINNAIIGPDGELYRCEHCIGKKNYQIGTVKEGFWRNPIDNAFLFMSLPEECYQCKYLPVCAGGCPANRIIYNLPMDCENFIESLNRQVCQMNII